ncbi:FMN reductase [Streptomyces sp. NBC_01231]|nr:FMN reductase [Streptomyces sp. NBC_01231]
MKLVVVSAGLSVPSSTRLLADRLATAVGRLTSVDGQVVDTEVVDTEIVDPQVADTQVVETQVVELRDLAVEIAHNFTNGFPGRKLAAAIDAVTGADGLIVVTPVFSASYSGLFKSFFDVLGVSDEDALAGKPVLIAATGGTARHSLVLDHALRPLFAHLRAVVVPTGVYAASEDWGAEGLDGRIERAAGELAGLMTGLSAGTRGQQATRVTPPAQVTQVPKDGSGNNAGGSGDLGDFAVVPFEERLAALRV